MKEKRKMSLNLIENAKDSLHHAVDHLIKKDQSPGELKRAIRDVAHAVELLLKERLSRIHPAFVWEDIDKYPSRDARTISPDISMHRLMAIGGIPLSEKARSTIASARRWRNDIEHYEFSIDFDEAKRVVGRLLSFIFDFAKRHLSLDLEAELRKDKRWAELIKFAEFLQAHTETVELQLKEEGCDVINCGSCGATTFRMDSNKCALCGHIENLVQCESCKEIVFESDTETIEFFDGDEDGVYGGEYITCRTCLEEERSREEALEAWADQNEEP